MSCVRLLPLLLIASSLTAQPPAPSIAPNVSGFEGYVGESFSAQLTVQNPPPSATFVNWGIGAGSLPSGVILNPATGMLAGTPPASQITSFRVDANYQLLTGGPVVYSRTYTFATDIRASLVTASPLAPATAGVAMTRTITASTSSFWDVGSTTLPQTISVNFPSGAGTSISFSGIFPSVASPTSYTAQVYANTAGNINQSLFRNYAITVNPAPSLSPNLSPALISTPYSAALTVNGGTPPFTYTLLGGTLPIGLTLNASTGQISGTPAVLGTMTFSAQVTDTNGATASNFFSITVQPLPLSINSAPLPDGTVGQPYAFSITANGGIAPYSFSLISGSLPPGLTFRQDGLISGTPTTAGLFPFDVTVTDALRQTASLHLGITIAPALLTILTGTLPDGAVGTIYSSSVIASGGTPPYNFSVSAGSPPPGLTLTSAGSLNGSPTTSGTYSFTITARDAAGRTSSMPYRVSIAAALQLTTQSLPTAISESVYSASLTATGGVPPYLFDISSGALPSGLQLSTSGVISGTPTSAGTFNFTARVADAFKATAQRDFSITVQPRPVITTTSLPNGTVGTSYSATLTGTGTAPLSWSISSGSLPSGLTLGVATGTISGTPASAGTFRFTALLSDGNAPALSTTRDLSIQVDLPPLPTLTIAPLGNSTPAGSQPAFSMALSQSYPLALAGTARLSFVPDGGAPQDPDIRFSTGGTSIDFAIPAGDTNAVPVSGSQFAFQAGTTAGTITLTVTMRQGDSVMQPDPLVTRIVRVERSAPVITGVRINRTSSGFEVLVTGYSNTREITGASLRFAAASGSSLSTSDFTVAVQSIFQTWYAGATSQGFGGQFLLTIPFNVSGNTSSLSSVQVTLTNSIGSATGSANF